MTITSRKTLISGDRIAWALIILIMILTGLVRGRLINVPLERDEGEYAYAGQLILQGVMPYQYAYTMKLPGVCAVYALIIAVFGQTHEGVHAGLLVVNAITLVLVFLLARHFMRSPAAVAAAAVFAVLSVNHSVEGIFANAEHFVILFAAAGTLLLFKALDGKNNFSSFFMAGLFFGLGFVMKQHGLAFCILAVLYVILDHLLRKPIQWRRLFFNLLALSAGQAAIVGFLLLIIVWTGVFENFWFWTVEYAGRYVTRTSFVIARYEFIETASRIFHSSPLLWILAGLGFVFLAAGKMRKTHKVFLFLYAVFSFLSIIPGLYFRPHYFVLLLPCAGVLSAVAADVLCRWLSRFLPAVVSCGIPALFIVIGIGQAIHRERNYLFDMSPFEISRMLYDINPFPESLPVASFIRDHTTPDDTIVILGSEPQILFYAQRRSASGYIYMYPLMEQQPFALQMQKDFINDIETQKPKYLIFVDNPLSWHQTDHSNQLIFEWMTPYLQTHCRLVGTVRLSEDKPEYQWGPQEWPALTLFSILILERNS